MSEHVFTIIQITYTVALPLVCTYLVNLVKGHERANQNGKETDMLLLRRALIDIHDKAMADGYISRYNFQSFEDTWELYHTGYHGNSLTDRFHDEVKRLPIR